MTPAGIGFLDLPAEIRLQIYAYLLLVPSYNRLLGEAPTGRPYVAVLRANRKIHAEAKPTLYAQNTFLAHPTMLASFPRLRPWYPPIREASVIKHIRRFHILVRLDCDLRRNADEVSAAFSGMDELTIEVRQAMFMGASYGALRVFEGVRGVKKATVFGSTTGFERYAAWLETAIRSDVGSEVPGLTGASSCDHRNGLAQDFSSPPS